MDIARLEFVSVLQRRFRNQELSMKAISLLQTGFSERRASFTIQPLAHFETMATSEAHETPAR